MIAAVWIAVAFALGVDPRRLGVLALAIYLPHVVAVLLAVLVWRVRPRSDTRSALFCEAVASELRAGASLRDSLRLAAAAVGLKEAATEETTDGIASSVSAEFEDIGDELALTIRNAGRSGSDAAALFDEIGSLALAQAEVAREVRTATAPGRATALILTLAPVLYLTSQVGSGGLGRLLITSQQRTVSMIGLGLFLMGLTSTALIVWRASR